ncbi:MAG: hypothetical protein J6B50_11765 [Lachnospiraceae bacterium]|nr:hypothetical protein [Lachnospiraceae bacterium]
MDYEELLFQLTSVQTSLLVTFVLLVLTVCLILIIIFAFRWIIMHPREFDMIVTQIERFFRGR